MSSTPSKLYVDENGVNHVRLTRTVTPANAAAATVAAAAGPPPPFAAIPVASPARSDASGNPAPKKKANAGTDLMSYYDGQQMIFLDPGDVDRNVTIYFRDLPAEYHVHLPLVKKQAKKFLRTVSQTSVLPDNHWFSAHLKKDSNFSVTVKSFLEGLASATIFTVLIATQNDAATLPNKLENLRHKDSLYKKYYKSDPDFYINFTIKFANFLCKYCDPTHQWNDKANLMQVDSILTRTLQDSTVRTLLTKSKVCIFSYEFVQEQIQRNDEYDKETMSSGLLYTWFVILARLFPTYYQTKFRGSIGVKFLTDEQKDLFNFKLAQQVAQYSDDHF